MKSKLELIEAYAQERVHEAIAHVNGCNSRERMCRDNARDILRRICKILKTSHEDYWRGE